MNSSHPQESMPARTGSPALVQALGPAPAVPVDARVVGRDRQWLYLNSPCALGPGAAVRIDVNGGMVLGEVAECSAGPEGHVLSVSISQVIPSLSDLAKLMQRVMIESDRTRIPGGSRAPDTRAV